MLASVAAAALFQLAAPMQGAIDAAVRKAMDETQVPSVSIAIVQDAKIAYVRTYGSARLDPQTPARPEMRYKIASNSKQFLCAAILMLAEEGKLSLDDPVARFLPELTRAKDIAIRQLLSHTSGYQDYYPLDYVAPFMARETTPQHILDVWARKALDFEPGMKWQYSNTNYTVAGLIVEKITGKPLIAFLRARIFEPLGMRSPIDVDREPWSDQDPLGYTRFALGPLRPVKPEGSGWMYAAGELAMTARDLATWNISLIEGTLLKPESLAALTAEAKLANGSGTGYALGLSVTKSNGRRKWAHGGGASGFLSQNFTLPDDRAAVTVLTNGETPAHQMLARQIEQILVDKSLEIVRRLFRDLQQGKLDRSLLSEDAIAYFDPQALADFEASLKPLGEPSEFHQTEAHDRGGMTERTFAIKAGGKALSLSTYWTPDGKVAQYLITPSRGQ